MSKASKVVIILLNYNGYTDTLECLKSLKKVSYENFLTIVVDNGSKDGSTEKIRDQFPETPILQTGENLGFAGGNNIGISWALDHHAEWILLLNNDTVVDPLFLTELMEATHKKPHGGIFGTKILKYDQPNIIDHLGGYWEEKAGEFFSRDSGEKDHPYYEMQQADYVCGASMLFSKNVVKKIGLLEPKFFLFWEETDYCYRAKRNGFEVWTVPKAKIWHKVSSSFTGGKPHMHYFWWRSRLLWVQRNCSTHKKKELYRKIILPEVWKMTRHFIIKSMTYCLKPSKKKKENIRRDCAGIVGVIHFLRGKFGSCPDWLIKKR